MDDRLRVREVRDLDQYPPIALSFAESDLSFPELPYVVVRAEPCACGESVRQHSGESVTAVVVRHNASRRHQAWRVTLDD